MIHIKPPHTIEIKESPGKGLGVFATTLIYEGEIIETCHLITLPIDHTTGHILTDYRFNWPQGLNAQEQVIALGYGSLYNHSNNPNARWEDHPEHKAFNFIATQNIFSGEEICVYYGGNEYWNDGRADKYSKII